jgi:WD40 repeat protein
MRLWEVATGREMRTIDTDKGKNGVQSLVFSPDSKFLASGYWFNAASLWEASTGQEVRKLSGDKGNVGGCVYGMAFSPDGGILALGGMDYNVTLWDIAAAQGTRALKTSVKEGVAFSADGKTLVIAGRGGSTVFAELRDVSTGQKIRDFGQGGSTSNYATAFSPDGKILAMGGGKDGVDVWEIATGRKIGSISAGSQRTRALALSPDGKLLASSEEQTGIGSRLHLWDVATGQKLRTLDAKADLPLPDQPNCLAFSPDGKLLAAGHSSVLILWDITEAK